MSMSSRISSRKIPILPKDKEVSIGGVDGGGMGLWGDGIDVESTGARSSGTKPDGDVSITGGGAGRVSSSLTATAFEDLRMDRLAEENLVEKRREEIGYKYLQMSSRKLGASPNVKLADVAASDNPSDSEPEYNDTSSRLPMASRIN
jgi:hypothetical protein